MRPGEGARKLASAVRDCSRKLPAGEVMHAAAQALVALLIATRRDALEAEGVWVPPTWERKRFLLRDPLTGQWRVRDGAIQDAFRALESERAPSVEARTEDRDDPGCREGMDRQALPGLADWVSADGEGLGLGRLDSELSSRLVVAADLVVTENLDERPAAVLREALVWSSEALGRDVQEFVVPERLSSLVAELAGLHGGMSCADVNAGWGMLLSWVGRLAHEREWTVKYSAQSCSQIGEALLWLSGTRRGEVRRGDAIHDPMTVDGEHSPRLRTFDCVVTVAPSMWPRGDRNRLRADPYQRVPLAMSGTPHAAALHLCHVWAAIAPAGRAAVVVPLSPLFRRGADGDVRRFLLEEGAIDAVIGLPAGLWRHTSIQTAIVVLQRDRPRARRDSVLIGTVRNTRGRGDWDLTEDEVQAVSDCVRDWTESDAEVATRVLSHGDLGDDHVLVPFCYIDGDVPITKPSLGVLARELRNLEAERDEASRDVDRVIGELDTERDHA